MNDCPSPVVVQRKDGPHYRPPAARNHRHVTTDEKEADAGDPAIKCTGKSCQSCTAGLIADCVAICCCPCAVVNILAFALLKVPWTIGKRVLKMGENKKKNPKNSKLRKIKKCDNQTARIDLELDGGGGSTDTINCCTTTTSSTTTTTISSDFVLCHDFENEELRKDEEDRWFELYQVGHLGFGRFSFTGIPSSLWKGN